MSGPSPSAERLQRLLAMVPWVAAQDGPTLSEICSRFDITPAQLAADLEVIWLVGLPPYTPDALVDVVQEGDRVWIHYAEVFAAAHRLTPDQAVALLTAGASVLALPGADAHGALASGVAKLAELLGVDADQVLDIDLGSAAPDVVAVLRAGIDEGRQVHLDYYSYGRDTRTERDVDPVRPPGPGRRPLPARATATSPGTSGDSGSTASPPPTSRGGRRPARRTALHGGVPGRGQRPRVVLELPPHGGVGARRLPGGGGRGAPGRVLTGHAGGRRRPLARPAADRHRPRGTGRGRPARAGRRGRSRRRAHPRPIP